MNKGKVRGEWQKFKNAFGGSMFAMRHIGQDIRWAGSRPDLLARMIDANAAEAGARLDECIAAVSAIRGEF